MDYLLTLLEGVLGDADLARLLFIAAVGLSTVLAVVTLGLLVNGLQDPVQRRLNMLKHAHGRNGQSEASGLQLLLEQVGERFGKPQAEATASVRTLLMHAGYRQPAAVQAYWAARLLLILLFSGLTMTALPFVRDITLMQSLLGVGMAATAGWLAPAIYVDKRRQARMRSLPGCPGHAGGLRRIGTGAAAVHRPGGRGADGQPCRSG